MAARVGVRSAGAGFGLLMRFCLAVLLLFSPGMPARAAPPVGYDALVRAAQASMLSDPVRASALADDAGRAAERTLDGRARLLARAQVAGLKGEARFRQNDIDAAQPLVDRAMAVVRRLDPRSRLHGDLLLSRARIALARGQVSDALRSFELAAGLFADLHVPRSEAIALQGIGSIYLHANDYKKVLEYYAHASEVYSGDMLLELAGKNARAIALRELGRRAEAETEFQVASRLAQQLGKGQLEARVLANLADLQIKAGQYPDAAASIARGLKLANSAEAADVRPILLAVAANLALHRNEVARARALTEAAWRQVGSDNGSVAFRDLHVVSYEAAKRAGDMPAALAHLEALKEISEKSTSVATSANAALAAARFDFANQDLRIARLKAGQLQRDVALAEARQRQSRIMLAAVLLLSGAALLFLSIYTRSVRRSRNQIRAANDGLTRANVQLEKALEAKTQFLATTSHEIRTPLNGILGMTQVMLADTSSPAAMRERIAMVHAAGETMRALVDDILDLAKLETGNLQIVAEPLDLRALASNAVSFWQDRADAKGLDLTLDLSACPETILGDAGRLRQVLFNLLANAIKFTPRGGVALKVVTREGVDGARLLVSVADSGIGIPADAFESIFEKFHQLDGGTNRQFGGTGLGLAISRNLVEAMNGVIRVESEVGVGSSFTVDLPLRLAPAASAVDATERRGRILLTGANPIARGVLKAMLEPCFVAVEFVDEPDLADALARFEADVVVIDGGTDPGAIDDRSAGLEEAARAAHRLGAGAAVLWPAPDEAILATLARYGYDAVIAKPVGADMLVAQLRALAMAMTADGHADIRTAA